MAAIFTKSVSVTGHISQNAALSSDQENNKIQITNRYLIISDETATETSLTDDQQPQVEVRLATPKIIGEA